jgi:type I restriction enzyme S subunit
MRVDRRRVFAPFLCYALNSDFVASQLAQMARGAIMEGLNTTILRECLIPLPELPEQQRIAALLDQADRLRRTRRYALELTSTFLPAAFLEHFGDPVANSRGWEPATVADLGDVETGNTPPRENAEYYGDAIEWVKSDNISLAQVQPTRAVEGLSEKGIAVGRFVGPGSLLLTCIAGSETSIGNVVLTDRRVAFNQQINAVTPHRGVDPRFLYGLFVTAKPTLQRSTTLAMKRMLTKGKLEQLLLIRPPIPAQQRFSAVVERVERLRTVQREALRQAEHLFASLLHCAFSG